MPVAPEDIIQLEHLNYIIFGAARQEGLFFLPFLPYKEDDIPWQKQNTRKARMAVGQTKVWDGTYGPDGIKHYIPVYSTKSSGDLEKTVNKMKADVENRKYVRPTEQDFVEYAKEWLKTYKAGREKATRAMYSNIIDVHFKPLKGIKLADIQKKHFQQIINNAYKMPRTCQQINITFHQVIQNGIQEKFLPADALTEICSNIDIPKYKPKEKRPLTALEKTGTSQQTCLRWKRLCPSHLRHRPAPWGSPGTDYNQH